MRILLVLILNIITAPFRWLSGAMYKRHEVLRLQITFGPGRAHIVSQCGSAEPSITHLVVAYLLFLSRYFFICDERQTTPVAEHLAKYMKTNSPPSELAGALLETVHVTLNQNEKDAVTGLFSFPNLPPLTYSEGASSGVRMAQYSLTIYKTNDLWSIDFHMSAGPDIVLLPITVGILYHYVTDKIGDENREVLTSCISQLLAAQESSDCRSVLEASRIPNMVISKNLET